MSVSNARLAQIAAQFSELDAGFAQAIGPAA